MRTNIDYRNELLEVFEEWRAAHCSDNETEKTCPDKMSKRTDFVNSFIVDGCVDYDEYAKADCKVLFVLKEPAILRENHEYIKTESIEQQMDNHWYKDVICGEGNIYKKYYRKFVAMCDVLGVIPETTAMMNINKRGGYSTGTDVQRLSDYAKHYRKYILRQIEVLKPDIIVSCILKGEDVRNLFADDSKKQNLLWRQYQYSSKRNIWLYSSEFSVEGKDTKTQVLSMPHPAIRISANEYGRIFKEECDSVFKVGRCHNE